MIPKQKARTKCFRNRNGRRYVGYADCSRFIDVYNIMLDLRKKGKRCFQENQGLYYRIFVEKRK